SSQTWANIMDLGRLRGDEATDPENGPRAATESRAGSGGPDLNLSEVGGARRSPSPSAPTPASAAAETQAEPPAASRRGTPASQASTIWAQAAEQTEARAQGAQARGGGLGI